MLLFLLPIWMWLLHYILSYKNSIQLAFRQFSRMVALYCNFYVFVGVEFRICLIHHLTKFPFTFKGICFFHKSNLGPQTLSTSYFSASTSPEIELFDLMCPTPLQLKNYIFSRRIYLLSILGPYTYPDLPSTFPHSCSYRHQLPWAQLLLTALKCIFNFLHVNRGWKEVTLKKLLLFFFPIVLWFCIFQTKQQENWLISYCLVPTDLNVSI